MSTNTMEKALWDITVRPEIVGDDALLGQYALAQDERALIKAMDVRQIADRGASQMLIWMAWVATRGFEAAPEYLRRMNTPAKSGE